MQRVWSTYLVTTSPSLSPADSPNNSMDFSHRHPNVSRRSLLRQDSFVSDTTVHASRDNISLESTTNLSLSVNYIPNKFSGFRNRKSGKYGDEPNLPKTGGGLLAFRTNEARMPRGKRRLRWNKFKWILFATNILFTLCSIIALVVCLLIWFDVWDKSDVIRVANTPELVLSTVAALLGILTSLIGWAGILLNNRGFLAWYTFLTWIIFAFLVIPGYMTYKQRTFNLEGKINAQWSRDLDTEDRLRIQNQLKCCGYFSPFVEATVSQTCYARSILPGCKEPYLAFERALLKRWYTVIFSLVPAHILIMVAGLLCSNHITYRFGKGMMPEAYRLNASTMAVIMDNYANQLAGHYGVDTANNIQRTPARTLTTTPSPLSTRTPSHSRADATSYPFKSKFARQSSQLYNAS